MKKVLLVVSCFIALVFSACSTKEKSIENVSSDEVLKQDYKCQRGAKWVVFTLTYKKGLSEEDIQKELKIHSDNLLMEYHSCEKM